MNISAILITTPPENTPDMMQALNELPGVEVYHHELASGKIIAVQEAESIDQEVEGLKKIKKLPGIILAEMVEHYFGDDNNLYPESAITEMNESCGIPTAESCVPEYLNQ